MLKKINRLKRNRQFQYIYKKGERAFSNCIILMFTKTKLTYKIGFSVSTKVGSAVVRNSVKRKLREIFRSLDGKINPHFNYIVIAKQGIEKMSFENIKRDCVCCLKRADKWCGNEKNN